MTSVQERLNLKRVPLDKWSVREQLCLASAVASSGDQNWMSVSRSLKMLCMGNNRPNDWFSQKSCAAQYGKLLENAETPKRKKRTASERDNSNTAVETPTESILRKLTQERISELKKSILQEQQDFMKLKFDVELIQNIETDESKIREMWSAIELEKKEEEQKQQLYAQWLKEREEKKLEMERAWRPLISNSPNQSPKLIPLKIKPEEMEIDDGKQSGTSPLLTSLLKSPSPAPNPIIIHSVINTPTSSRPVPVIQNLIIPTNQLTPSGAAPTLSALLENKPSIKDLTNFQESGNVSIKEEEEELFPKNIFPDVSEILISTDDVKDDDQQLMDDFNSLIPDNIDELADIANNLNPELLNENFMNHEKMADEDVTNVLEKMEKDVIETENFQEIVLIPVEEPKKEIDETFPEIIEETAPEMEFLNKTEDLEKKIIEEENPKEIIEKSIDSEVIKIETVIDDDKIVTINSSDSEDAPLSKSVQKIEETIEPVEILKEIEPEIKQEIMEEEIQKPIEENIVQEPEKMELKSEPKDLEEEISEKNRKMSTDDDIFEDAKDEPIEEDPHQDSDQINTVLDTDDDSPIEVIKEDKVGKTKRDYSRKKMDLTESQKQSSHDDGGSSSDDKGMKNKERERSESPPSVMDEDGNDSTPRTSRRTSSTPNIDSVPNSPASSDDREYRVWRKSILMVYNRLSTHKYASAFLRPITEEQSAGYKNVIYRPMDLQTIKRNIENGLIRTTIEFQREVMLMCVNAIMFNRRDSNAYNMAKELMSESNAIIETSMDTWKKDSDKFGLIAVASSVSSTTSSASKGRSSRKSQRMSAI